jgi:hypothetical protein
MSEVMTNTFRTLTDYITVVLKASYLYQGPRTCNPPGHFTYMALSLVLFDVQCGLAQCRGDFFN